MIGPREGYSPYIGSLVSMMNYNRSTILKLTKGLTMEHLDHLQDPQSNSIGSLLMHLAAVDKIYYILCFEKSHHRGQISWLKKRLPGMQDTKD